jgi:hypothetical protein
VKPILFLDIDGVLNSHAFFKRRMSPEQAAELRAYPVPQTAEEHCREMIDPAAVALLGEILDKSGALIVISSSWRIVYTLGEIGRALDANGFQHRRSIIGVTPGGGGHRGAQIDEWLDLQCELPPAHFAILDDSDDMEPHKARLVRTSYDAGLQPCHVPLVLQLLGVKS